MDTLSTAISILTFISLIVGFGSIIWKGGILAGTITTKLDKTEKDIEKIEHSIEKLRGNLEKHNEKLATQDSEIRQLSVRFGESHSPIKPNEEGQKILKESGFYDVYPKIQEDVFQILDSQNTRTLYDAEKNSFNALARLSDRPMFDQLKNYAVNKPEIPLELIFSIASWIIRDDYAQKRGIEK